jgi:hypothetical protein
MTASVTPAEVRTTESCSRDDLSAQPSFPDGTGIVQIDFRGRIVLASSSLAESARLRKRCE